MATLEIMLHSLRQRLAATLGLIRLAEVHAERMEQAMKGVA